MQVDYLSWCVEDGDMLAIKGHLFGGPLDGDEVEMTSAAPSITVQHQGEPATYVLHAAGDDPTAGDGVECVYRFAGSCA